MQKITLYEQLGIVIPGSVLMLGLVLYFPNLKVLTVKDTVSIGELGLFVLIAYAAGHFIAAVGNALESVFWRLCGGMPSDWVVSEKPSLLSPPQIEQLHSKLGSRLNITLENLEGLDRKTWWPISRQVYADVAKNGKPDRIDTFNGNYGLNRGLSSACLVLALVAATHQEVHAAIGLAIVGLVFGYRMYRFGVHYARELYLQFLVLA
jgi:hypothetical protein